MIHIMRMADDRYSRYTDLDDLRFQAPGRVGAGGCVAAGAVGLGVGVQQAPLLQGGDDVVCEFRDPHQCRSAAGR